MCHYSIVEFSYQIMVARFRPWGSFFKMQYAVSNAIATILACFSSARCECRRGPDPAWIVRTCQHIHPKRQ